jgi:predicted  nucleic acid-binding Zn-ribbon protein
MNAILQPLLKLQTIEFGPHAGSAAETEAVALRATIPATVLAHYERFRARGKKGVATVSNQVCSGCHMAITTAKLTSLMRGADIERCDSCGRYLCLPPAVEVISLPPPAKKPRKRKALATAA